MTKFEEYFKKDVKFSRDYLKSKGAISSQFNFYRSDGKIIVVLAIFNNYEEKQKTWEAVNLLLKTENIPFYTFMTESWYYKQKNTGKPPRYEGPAVDHPDREEALVIQGLSKDKSFRKQVLIPFKKKNNKIKFEEETETDEFDSRTDFFDEKNSKELLTSSMMDLLKHKGSKEIIKLPRKNYQINIYRYRGKAYFEACDAKGESFCGIEPTDDDQDFEDKIEQVRNIFGALE